MSEAYRALSLWGRAVLVEIVLAMNGYNNGRIALSQRQLASRLDNSNFRQIGRAIAELVSHGLVAVEADGMWRPRLAREYRLTFVNTGTIDRPIPATNEYLGWRAGENSRADTASARRAKSADTVSAGKEKPAEAVPAENGPRARRPVRKAADPVSPLIGKPCMDPQDKAGSATQESRVDLVRINQEWLAQAAKNWRVRSAKRTS